VPGPRVFTPREVDLLIPRLEALLGELDLLRGRIRDQKLRIDALEMIWGSAVQKEDNPDHREYQHHLTDMRSLQEEFEKRTHAISELGGQLKGFDPPLIDFLGVRDGHLVLLCWTKGEKKVAHWHEVDEGFAGRQPI
jgi:hypothetical protein